MNEQEHQRRWKEFSTRLDKWMLTEPLPCLAEFESVMIDAAMNSNNPICAIEKVERRWTRLSGLPDEQRTL